jgi:hypothetical protein
MHALARNLGYVQLAIIEVTNRQIAPQLLKYFGDDHRHRRLLRARRERPCHSRGAYVPNAKTGLNLRVV